MRILREPKSSAWAWVCGAALLVLVRVNAYGEEWWTQAGDPKNFSATVTSDTDNENYLGKRIADERVVFSVSQTF